MLVSSERVSNAHAIQATFSKLLTWYGRLVKLCLLSLVLQNTHPPPAAEEWPIKIIECTDFYYEKGLHNVPDPSLKAFTAKQEDRKLLKI